MSQQKEDNKRCPLCGSEKTGLFLETKDYSISKESFVLQRCQDCTFVFTVGVPDENDADIYYESDSYISHSDTKKGPVNYVYHFVRDLMLVRKRRLIMKLLKGSGSLLDIGTGTGYFLHIMQKAGFTVSGMEKNRRARQFTLDHFDIHCYTPEDFMTLAAVEEFDVVTMWHVLEHLYEPDQYLEKIKNVLKNSGFLIIALPNVDSYDAKHYQQYWAGYDVPRHLWHYSPETFKKFAKNNGFRVLRLKRLPFDSFYISLLSEQYKRQKAGWIPGLFHGKISWLKSLFDAGKSSSVIYILQKDIPI